MSDKAALRDLIDAAYTHFACPAPPTTGVCRGCCMDPDIEADFLDHAPRDLPEEHLEDWYFAAYAPDLSRAHMAWLLPRILDLLAFAPGFPRQGAETALNRLPLTGFPEDWPPKDVVLLRQAGLAIFARRLAEGGDVDEWLCCFGEAGLDLAPFFAHLDALGDDRLLTILTRAWPTRPGAAIPFSAFWARQPAKDGAWAWYTSRQLHNRLSRIALTEPSETALAFAALIEHHADWAQPTSE
ncbi:hypothetical protein ACW9UR_01915 [Halovulum sp. GXIMD14794]